MPEPSRAAATTDEGHQILLVDDDPFFSDLVAKVLSPKAGFGGIAVARSLAQAFERLETSRLKLIILDLNLPDSRGMDTLKEIREKAKDAYILVMTSVMDEELGLQALKQGAHDYFVKGRVPPQAMQRIARYAIERRAVELAMRKSRDDMEVQLRHAQKMESIGQLAAGIAHEINTPIQFVGDNCRFLEEAFQQLLSFVLELQPQLERGSLDREQITALKNRMADLDLDYVKDEIPRAIQQSLEGVGRVTNIVSAMKDFSHPGTSERQFVDINRAIESTLTVSNNAWKYAAEMKTEFQAELPLVPCFPGEFNQVVLNLVVNAAHAIEEARANKSDSALGLITVSTRQIGREVEVKITDNGAGMPPHIQSRIFEPFFTTKEVGKGTGQGLSIAHSVIVDKHKGRIELWSELGVGTTFTIRLPLDGLG